MEYSKLAEHPLFLCFVDLRKAYDTVNRAALWEVMKTYNIPPDVIRRIRDLHTNTEVQVRAFGGLSDKFLVDSGVRQGCVMSPTLFNVFMDFIVKKTLNKKDFPKGVRLAYRVTGQLKWVHTSGVYNPVMEPAVEYLNIMLYADDIVLTTDNAEDLKTAISMLDDAFCEAGMEISTKKTEILTVGGNDADVQEIFVRGEKLKVVDSFVFLGTKLSSDCSTNPEMEEILVLGPTYFGDKNQDLPNPCHTSTLVWG